MPGGDTFQVAVVGAGLASPPHLASLLDPGGRITVRHVVGHSLERASAVAQARAGTDLDAALRDEVVEGVLLLTPPDTHLALGRLVAEAGKHLLIEKPVALTSGWARDLVAACEANRVTAAAVLQHRTRVGAVKLRQLLRCGKARSGGCTAPALRCHGGVRSPTTTERGAARLRAMGAEC